MAQQYRKRYGCASLFAILRGSVAVRAKQIQHNTLNWLRPTVADGLEGGERSLPGIREAAEVLLRGGDLAMAEAVHDHLEVRAAASSHEAGAPRRSWKRTRCSLSFG